MKVYICKHCGNVITKLTSAQVPVKCCGEEMHVLEAGVTDAAQEKHVPAVTVEGSLVKVDVGRGGGPDCQGRLCLLQPPRSLEEGPVSCETPDRPGAAQRRGGLLTFEIGYI